jgi:hypothetical protein
MGDWVYFTPKTTTGNGPLIIENPFEYSWFNYTQQAHLGLKTVENMICLKNHVAVIGLCHDDFNTLKDKTVPLKRIVILAHGGERSYLYKRILTSHNFVKDQTKAKTIKHVSESMGFIYVTYTETESSGQSAYQTIVINKAGPQAYTKIIGKFDNSTSAKVEDKNIQKDVPVNVNSYSNVKDSNSKPISLKFNVLRHQIELTKVNKSIQNKVLRRQNFTTTGMSYIENFLNITGPIYNMYVAKTTSKGTSTSTDILKGVFPEEVD